MPAHSIRFFAGKDTEEQAMGACMLDSTELASIDTGANATYTRLQPCSSHTKSAANGAPLLFSEGRPVGFFSRSVGTDSCQTSYLILPFHSSHQIAKYITMFHFAVLPLCGFSIIRHWKVFNTWHRHMAYTPSQHLCTRGSRLY